MYKNLLSLLAIICLCSFVAPIDGGWGNFDMTFCKTGHNGDVQAGDILKDGKVIGSIISVSRASGDVKAKYFAYKDGGKSVHDRYDVWRKGKEVVLISSGAYADGFSSGHTPIGLTIDNGNYVNTNFSNDMDGLVIVEAVGGVRISNIEDGDLKIKVGKDFETVDIRKAMDRTKFIAWCQSESATVFQTHLLIYDNQIKVGYANSSKSRDVRRLLIMAKDRSGTLYHIILYTKEQAFTLYDIADYTLKLLNNRGYQIISAINLDTGGIDVLSTSTELSDCTGNTIVGKMNKDRRDLSNMLAYYTE